MNDESCPTCGSGNFTLDADSETINRCNNCKKFWFS